MKKLWMWFILLNKRLYKKITFLCILLMIPVLCIIFSASIQDPGGLLTIAIACENPEEVYAQEIVSDLKQDSVMISFIETTPQNARVLVVAGKVDAAWIIPADIFQRVEAFLNNEKNSEEFIKIIEQEQTIPLMLSREKLSSTFLKRFAKETYLNYLREVAPETQNVSDSELLTFVEKADVSGELFDFFDIHGQQREKSANYLTTPIRGMLAVLAIICSIVTAMYYQNDLNRGIFSLLPEKGRIYGEFCYQLISATNVLLFVIIALKISNLGVSIGRELIIFVLYSICCSLFGIVLRAVFGGERFMAVLIPVLGLIMLAICPVFFDLGSLRKIQLFLPPTYFVNAAYNAKYIWYLMAYNGILFVICVVISLMKSWRFQARLRNISIGKE